MDSVKAPGIVQRHPELRWLASAVLVLAVIALVTTSLSGVFRDGYSLNATGPEQVVSEVRAPHIGGYTGTILIKADLKLPRALSSAIEREVPVGGGLLSGSHTMRYWYGDERRQRLAVIEQNAEQDMFRNGNQVLLWDTTTRTVQHNAVDSVSGALGLADGPAALTPPQLAERMLDLAGGTKGTTLRSGDDVAGRPTYELVIVPSTPLSLIGAVHIQVDGRQAVPLGVQIYPRGSDDPVLDVAFTSITYGPPEERNFSFTPPPDATVQGISSLGLGAVRTVGDGWLRVVSSRTNATISSVLAGLFGTSMHAVKGPWGKGRLFSRGALSVLITSKGEVLAGAVQPGVLYHCVRR